MRLPTNKNTPANLIERLSPLEDLVYQALEDGIATGNIEFIKLWLLYYYGRPAPIKDEPVTEHVERVILLSNGTKISM